MTPLNPIRSRNSFVRICVLNAPPTSSNCCAGETHQSDGICGTGLNALF